MAVGVNRAETIWACFLSASEARTSTSVFMEIMKPSVSFWPLPKIWAENICYCQRSARAIVMALIIDDACAVGSRQRGLLARQQVVERLTHAYVEVVGLLAAAVQGGA